MTSATLRQRLWPTERNKRGIALDITKAGKAHMNILYAKVISYDIVCTFRRFPSAGSIPQVISFCRAYGR